MKHNAAYKRCISTWVTTLSHQEMGMYSLAFETPAAKCPFPLQISSTPIDSGDNCLSKVLQRTCTWTTLPHWRMTYMKVAALNYLKGWPYLKKAPRENSSRNASQQSQPISLCRKKDSHQGYSITKMDHLSGLKHELYLYLHEALASLSLRTYGSLLSIQRCRDCFPSNWKQSVTG